MIEKAEKIHTTESTENSPKVRLDVTSAQINAEFNSKVLSKSIDSELKTLQQLNKYFSFK